MKRVRMLFDHEVDGLRYRCDQVVDFPNDVARELVNVGAADASKEAVAFATKESGGKVLVHETEASRAAQAAVAAALAARDAAAAALEAEKDAARRATLGEALEAAEAALAAAQSKLAE